MVVVVFYRLLRLILVMILLISGRKPIIWQRIMTWILILPTCIWWWKKRKEILSSINRHLWIMVVEYHYSRVLKLGLNVSVSMENKRVWRWSTILFLLVWKKWLRAPVLLRKVLLKRFMLAHFVTMIVELRYGLRRLLTIRTRLSFYSALLKVY